MSLKSTTWETIAQYWQILDPRPAASREYLVDGVEKAVDWIGDGLREIANFRPVDWMPVWSQQLINFIVLQAITWLGIAYTHEKVLEMSSSWMFPDSDRSYVVFQFWFGRIAMMISLFVIPGFVIPDGNWLATLANEFILVLITVLNWRKWFKPDPEKSELQQPWNKTQRR